MNFDACLFQVSGVHAVFLARLEARARNTRESAYTHARAPEESAQAAVQLRPGRAERSWTRALTGC